VQCDILWSAALRSIAKSEIYATSVFTPWTKHKYSMNMTMSLSSRYHCYQKIYIRAPILLLNTA